MVHGGKTPIRRRARTGRQGAASPARRVRIVVADSQAIDRGGIVRLLEGERGFEVVGECADVPETIDQCRALKPDVLVLSLNLPGQEQSAAVPAIRSRLPALRILALSNRGETDCLVLNPPSRRLLSPTKELPCAAGTDCLQLAAARGAMGTLRRSADPEDLFRAIRSIAEGRAWYDASTAGRMLEAIGEKQIRGTDFTARELEVAALISEGQSNKEISTALRISEATVKKHVGHLMKKLGLADRLQVGLFLARHPQLLAQ